MGEDQVWRTHGGKPPISVTHPDLAAELVDQDLADELTFGSIRKVGWQCPAGHEWITTPNSRTNLSSGCPYCAGQRPVIGENDISTTHPQLAAELIDQSLATTVSSGTSRKVWWRCRAGHEWEATVASRAINGTGCPYCSGRRAVVGINDLATTHQHLVDELVDATIAAAVSAGSERSVTWRCATGHEWDSTIAGRVGSGGCPYCSGVRVVTGETDLVTTHPALAAELVDQGLATVIGAGSGKKVEWRCVLGHEWTCQVYRRGVEGTGCPYCTGKRVLVNFNDLATTHPAISAELVDQALATVVSAGSDRKAMWECPSGHRWRTSVSSRVRGRGCPECATYGFSPIAPAWLYLIATPGRSVLKYGVTNHLDQRLDQHRRQGFTEVLETIMFDTGAEAITVERLIRAHSRANGWATAMTAASMPFGGATETLMADQVGDDFTLRDFVPE